jgi:hypothetical protein
MKLNTSKAAPASRAAAVRWGIAIVALLALAGWYLDQPDSAAVQRQQTCERWGVTDTNLLAKCRQGPDQQNVILQPLMHQFVDQQIKEFNQDLVALEKDKTRTDVRDYSSESIEDVAKVTGGNLLGLIMPNDTTAFRAKGQRVKFSGVIVTHEPDPDNPPIEPRYFTVQSEFHIQNAAPSTAKTDVTMPTIVNLDIESLNRYERQFMIDHCADQITTPCKAAVFGRIDEIVGRRSGGLRYIGVLADQIDIEALNTDTPNPWWFPQTVNQKPR